MCSVQGGLAGSGRPQAGAQLQGWVGWELGWASPPNPRPWGSTSVLGLESIAEAGSPTSWRRGRGEGWRGEGEREGHCLTCGCRARPRLTLPTQQPSPPSRPPSADISRSLESAPAPAPCVALPCVSAWCPWPLGKAWRGWRGPGPGGGGSGASAAPQGAARTCPARPLLGPCPPAVGPQAGPVPALRVPAGRPPWRPHPLLAALLGSGPAACTRTCRHLWAPRAGPVSSARSPGVLTENKTNRESPGFAQVPACCQAVSPGWGGPGSAGTPTPA